MFIERKINPTSGGVELWWARDGVEGERTLVSKIADEQPLEIENQSVPLQRRALCWAEKRTLGNVEVRSPELLNHFQERRATNVKLPCDLVYAGKYRHGANRWWCRTHQCHWGTKADLATLHSSNQMQCANHTQPMNYEMEPYTINLDAHDEVGIWCSLPAAISTAEIKARPPKIHVHIRDTPEAQKCVDKDFAALSVVYSIRQGFLSDSAITRVDITPPAAFDFVCALEADMALGCINCSYCRCAHLDLGDFGKTPHRKHFCANCGRDSTWSKRPIISTPLQPLHERTATNLTCLLPGRTLNLDDYEGHSYAVWASTPAIVWTASRPQEYGIHVHVHCGTDRIIDDTFGEVILDGKVLVREELLKSMIDRTLI